jgi:uncharacterized protein
VTLAARQRATLGVVDHRPWALPTSPWVMGQTWEHLLFAHWPVQPEALRRVVPPALPLDLFDGRAWIGVTPFVVSGLHARGAPPLPGASRFGETNVRTYVRVGDRPGICFFSLDAASLLAVVAARAIYRLPYFPAAMRITTGDQVDYLTRRRSARRPAELSVRYAPAGPVGPAPAGSLEHWLTERYRLYTTGHGGRIVHADIHHPPWPLQPAGAEVRRMTMTRPLGIEVRGEPLLHYSERQDVLIWPPRAAGRVSSPGVG